MVFSDPLAPSLAARIIKWTSLGVNYSDTSFKNWISWHLSSQVWRIVPFPPASGSVGGGSTLTVSIISDQHPPPSTWSPAPGSGHTWCGMSLQLSSPGMGKIIPLLPDVRQPLSPLAAIPGPRWSAALRLSWRRQSSSPIRWFPVSPCSWLFPFGRVRWFPAPWFPLVPRADRKHWFP